MTTLSAHSGKTLTNLNMMAQNLSYLDVHDNKLGTGSMIIGEMVYQSKTLSDARTYWGINSLNTFYAYGNAICHQFSSNNSSTMERYGDFKIGSIPSGMDSLIMAEVDLTVGFNGSGKSYTLEYWFGDVYQREYRKSDGLFDTNRDGHIKRTDTFSQINSKGGCPSGSIVTPRYILRGNDNDIMSYMTIYPFGK